MAKPVIEKMRLAYGVFWGSKGHHSTKAMLEAISDVTGRTVDDLWHDLPSTGVMQTKGSLTRMEVPEKAWWILHALSNPLNQEPITIANRVVDEP